MSFFAAPIICPLVLLLPEPVPLPSRRKINAKDSIGRTPLMLAAINGDPDRVKALIAKGADVNAQDNNQHRTALMFAANKGSADCVKALIAAGADVKTQDKYGETVLEQNRYNSDIADILRNAEEEKRQALEAMEVEKRGGSQLKSASPPSGKPVRYRGLTFDIDGEYSLVCDDQKVVRGIWYRDRKDIKNETRNRMVVAVASVNGCTVLDSDYETTIVGGIGGVEDLKNPGGAILWFASAPKLFGK